MYNKGGPWVKHMEQLATWIRGFIPMSGRILEVGAGNGEFASLVDECLKENYLAYEPTSDADICRQLVETRQKLFIPRQDMYDDQPDLILMRHVLEHFTHPGDFLREMADAACEAGLDPWLIVEVPNVANAVRDIRIEDWVYEHPHHFTELSLQTLARRSGWYIDSIFATYNDEVLVAKLYPSGNSATRHPGHSCMFNHLVKNIEQVGKQIQDMTATRFGSVVLWGATGKGTTLVNLLRAGDYDIPVVDSDRRKWGYLVPGTDLVIRSPNLLKEAKPDLVIVTTSWRVRDIAEEIARKGYSVGRLAHLLSGALVTYKG